MPPILAPGPQCTSTPRNLVGRSVQCPVTPTPPRARRGTAEAWGVLRGQQAGEQTQAGLADDSRPQDVG
jgi:hypothetical protein